MSKQKCITINIEKTLDIASKTKLVGAISDIGWRMSLLDDKGNTNIRAVNILAELFYWHRYSLIENENGDIENRKKFKGDYLQKSYDQLALDTGFSKRQVKEGCKYLEEKGLIQMEFRTIKLPNGRLMNNVLYIAIVVEEVIKITGSVVAEKKRQEMKKRRELKKLEKRDRIFEENNACRQVVTRDIDTLYTKNDIGVDEEKNNKKTEKNIKNIEKNKKNNPCKQVIPTYSDTLYTKNDIALYTKNDIQIQNITNTKLSSSSSTPIELEKNVNEKENCFLELKDLYISDIGKLGTTTGKAFREFYNSFEDKDTVRAIIEYQAEIGTKYWNGFKIGIETFKDCKSRAEVEEVVRRHRDKGKKKEEDIKRFKNKPRQTTRISTFEETKDAFRNVANEIFIESLESEMVLEDLEGEICKNDLKGLEELSND